jgi:hypothetical protein
MPDQPGLGRLVVVGRDGEQGVRPGLLRRPRQLDAVVGVIGAHPGDDVRPVPHRLDHSPEHGLLLRVAGGGRLAGGATDHQTVVALLIDKVGGKPRGTLGVERTVRLERGHHRGEEPAEWSARISSVCHEVNLACAPRVPPARPAVRRTGM